MRATIAVGVVAMAAASASAAVSITAKTATKLDNSSYNNWSGATYAGEKDGASLFFLTRETSGVASTFGCPSGASDGMLLQPMSVRFNTDGSILDQTIGSAFSVPGLSDPEDLAYDPGNDSLWVADEGNKSIVEYRFTDSTKTALAPTYRSVPLPSWFTSGLRQNVGIQSVSISGDGLTLWTANDDALSCDGDTSYDLGTSAGPVVRLLKYTRATINDAWTLSHAYAYQCDACATKGISALGMSYDACHSGVSSLVALPQGAASEVLVIERNADTDTVGRMRVYAPSFSSATDIKDIAALDGASYTKASKGSSLGEYKDGSRANKIVMTSVYKNYHIVDYEGACLGPRLSNGTIAMLAVSSGGLYFAYDATIATITIDTYTYLRSFSVGGVDAYRVDFTAPSGVGTVPRGSGYLFMNGAQVSCSVPSVETGVYAPRFTYKWTAPDSSVTDSPNANFTISGGGTFTCSTSVDENSSIYAADSFEGYAVDTLASGITGWSGANATVAAAVPSIGAPPGFPMAETTHTKALNLADEGAVRTYDGSTGNRSFDALVKVVLGDATIDTSDSQIAIVFDRQGKAVVYYGDGEGGTATTTVPNMTFSEGEWVRVSLIFDYTTGPSEFVQVRLNGSPCWSEDGVKSPAESTVEGGSWYRAISNAATGLNSFTVIGDGAVDDVILRGYAAPGSEGFEIAAGVGQDVAAVDGVPVAWFNSFGFAWNGSTLAPGGSGYSLADVFKTGVDPYGDEELMITAFSIDDKGEYTIDTNGARSNPSATLTVQRADSPSGPWSASSEGNFFRVVAE